MFFELIEFIGLTAPIEFVGLTELIEEATGSAVPAEYAPGVPGVPGAAPPTAPAVAAGGKT